MIGLTPKQRDLLAFISHHPDATYAQMERGLGFKGRKSLVDRLNALAERGYLQRRRYGQPAYQLRTVIIRGEPYRFIPMGTGGT